MKASPHSSSLHPPKEIWSKKGFSVLPRMDSDGWVGIPHLHGHWMWAAGEPCLWSRHLCSYGSPKDALLKVFCPEAPSSSGDRSFLTVLSGRHTRPVNLSMFFFFPFSDFPTFPNTTGDNQCLYNMQSLSLYPPLSLINGTLPFSRTK